MLVQVKYEYEKKHVGNVQLVDVKTGFKSTIKEAADVWKGETVVNVDDKTTGNELVSKIANYLETMNDAIKGSVVVKKMVKLTVINL